MQKTPPQLAPLRKTPVTVWNVLTVAKNPYYRRKKTQPLAKVSMITQNVYPNTHKPKRLWTRLFAEIGVVLLVGQKILTWVGPHVGNSFVGIAVAKRKVIARRKGVKMWNIFSSWTWLTSKSNAMVQVTLQMPQKYADIRKHLKTLRYTYNEYKYNSIGVSQATMILKSWY